MENTNIISDWVEALRSNKFKKTEKALCKNVDGQNYHCAFGVLCEILNYNKVKLDNSNKIGYWNKSKGDYFPAYEYVPHSIRKDLNLTYEFIDYIMYLNDEAKQSFSFIADEIKNEIL